MSNNTANAFVYETLPERGGAGCKKTEDASNFNKAIQHAKGELSGFSRIAGAVSPDTRRAIIDLIIDEATRRGHAFRDVAYILLIARLESGFNPDAAACTTSASGVMQITNSTAMDVATQTKKTSWKKNNPHDSNIDITRAEDRFSARKNIIAGIIQYERCKAKAMRVLKTAESEKYEPRIYQYYHAGLYFDGDTQVNANKKDGFGLNEFAHNIQPFLNPVEDALKKRGKFQAKLTQPDGKPYSNVEYVALVPKKWTEVVSDRLFGWAANLFSKPAGRKDDANTSKAASSPPASTTASGSVAKPAPATPPASPPTPTAPAASAAQSAKPIAYPARIQDGAKYDVVRGKTDGEGKTAEISVPGTSEIYLCILEYDYDKKAANLQQQREENDEDQKSDDSSAQAASSSGNTSDQSSEAVTVTSSGNDITSENKNDDDGLKVEPTEQYTPRQMSAMYCGRKPDMEKIAEGFRQIGKPFETELLEFSRSYIVKPSAALNDVVPMTNEAVGKVQAEHISASVIKAQVKDLAKPIANVDTAPTNPNKVAQGNLSAPWMDIAIGERYQQQVPGEARQNSEWRKAREEIETRTKENKALNQEMIVEGKRPLKQRDEEKLLKLKNTINENKLIITSLLDKMIKIENLDSINNPRILEYFSATSVPGNAHAKNEAVDDEINWCGAFVSWCLRKAKYKISLKGPAARAREWVNYGEEAKENTFGAIVVLGTGKAKPEEARTSSGQHVGFLWMEGKNERGEDVIRVLGGNQTYDIAPAIKGGGSSKVPRVTVSEFKMSGWHVVARRMPTAQDKE